MTIRTRVGHIGPTDNRFLGRSVFEELSDQVASPADALALALGARLGEIEREALRLVALCTTSPDARVWPLKLCRLLASYGHPIAGLFGGQLISSGSIMGPGTAAGCAAGLAFVAERATDDAALEQAVAEWCERSGGRFPGFGVPFRPEDERLVAMRRYVAGTQLERRPYWILQQRVTDVMTRRGALQPNVTLGASALLLEAGIAPERCGVALALLMSHIFVAHSLEAAQSDGELRALPASAVDYQGVSPRSTRRSDLRVPPHPVLQRHLAGRGNASGCAGV